ncbi:gamma-tubulin complex component 5-like [Ciona intestinalis]
MAKNPKYHQALQQLTADLVSCLTKFPVGSENYESCLEYSMSNIKYHRFLEADGHRIERQISGLQDKFMIYSQPQKAQRLGEMFLQFVDNDITDNSLAKSQVHFSLLSIILHLSHHPIDKVYVKPKRKILQEEQDSFNWGEFLLEGEDQPTWTSSSEESDPEDFHSDEAERKPFEVNITPVSKFICPKHETKAPKINLPTAVAPYWKFNKQDCEVREDFERLCSLKSYKAVTYSDQLKEMHVLREIIWLLSGHDNLFIFQYKEGSYSISDCGNLTHITKASVKNSLEIFVEHANSLKLIRLFLNSVEAQVCLTYQAFAASLRTYIQWFDSDLLALENKVKSQDEIFLVCDIYEALQFHFQVISLLREIYDSSLKMDKATDTNAVKASRLLSTLYSAVITESMVNNTGADQGRTCLHVVLKLWLQSIKPYLDICDGWVSSGTLNDRYNEWLLCHAESYSDCRNAQFWKNAVLPAVQSISTLLPWLDSVLGMIVIGGKSMEIIQTLNMLNRENGVNGRINLHQRSRQKLFEQFENKFLSLVFGGNYNQVEPKGQKIKSLSNDQPEKEIFKNSLKLLFSTDCFTVRRENSSKYYQGFVLKSPIPVLIKESISPLVQEKCEHASSMLLEVFKTRFGLSTSLEVFHNFYLMGWGDVMHVFATEIFKLLQHQTTLNDDPVSFNIILQEAMAIRCSQSPGVFVSMNMDGQEQNTGLLGTRKKVVPGIHQLIHATDCIELQCPVEWPVNIVITEQSMMTYKRLFSYLMRIKRAVFCLEQLNFCTIYENGDNFSTESKIKCHRLSLLRHKMLHLLQQWYSYIMTSVIQSEKHGFLIAMEEAQSLDDIIAAHERFLSRVCLHCLIDETTQAEKLVQGTMKKILTFSITFHMLWSLGVDNVSFDLISKHESDFNECSVFLGRILRTIANRGSIPRLNALAYSIL